ncbi:MAG: trypsin-like peptidase domain-containing protein, partial [Longimicrobiales bacterium]
MMNGTEAGSVLRGLSDALAQAVESAGRSVVAIHARRRIPSSGVLWREGMIVTASHTLEREEDITVTWPDGTSTAATIAGRDPGTDMAVVRPQGGSAAVAEVADADALRVGALVLALGR